VAGQTPLRIEEVVGHAHHTEHRTGTHTQLFRSHISERRGARSWDLTPGLVVNITSCHSLIHYQVVSHMRCRAGPSGALRPYPVSRVPLFYDIHFVPTSGLGRAVHCQTGFVLCYLYSIFN